MKAGKGQDMRHARIAERSIGSLGQQCLVVQQQRAGQRCFRAERRIQHGSNACAQGAKPVTKVNAVGTYAWGVPAVSERGYAHGKIIGACIEGTGLLLRNAESGFR